MICIGYGYILCDSSCTVVSTCIREFSIRKALFNDHSLRSIVDTEEKGGAGIMIHDSQMSRKSKCEL